MVHLSKCTFKCKMLTLSGTGQRMYGNICPILQLLYKSKILFQNLESFKKNPIQDMNSDIERNVTIRGLDN